MKYNEEDFHLDSDGNKWAKRPIIVPSGPSILIEGPDGVGKTTIAKKMSELTHIPTFKATQEKFIFFNDGIQSLAFDYMLTQFLKQTGYRFLSDRSYVSEFCYAKVFGRRSDEHLLGDIDFEHSELGTKILYLYSSVQPVEPDDIVPSDRYWDVKNAYDEFCRWTLCRVLKYDTSQSLHLSGDERAIFDTLNCMKLLGMIDE